MELPGLTSLRGIAAMAVVLYHSSFLAYNFAAGGLPLIWRRGYLAVDLFFFLSGFVLVHVYGDSFTRTPGWRATRRFLWARLCRIYPASVFTLSVFVLLYLLGKMHGHEAGFGTQLAASLLMMQVPWLSSLTLNGFSWSVSAEVYAYLLFPVVVPATIRLNSRTAVALGAALLVVIGTNHALVSPEQLSFGWEALRRALPEFIAGIFAYRAYRARVFFWFWEKDATLLGLAMGIIAGCVVGVPDGLIVILMPALLLASVSNSGRMGSFLDAPPLRWLGDISYSIYIFQMVPFMLIAGLAGLLVANGLGGTWFEALAAALAVGCGTLVHRCIDVPIRAALRSLPDRIAGRRLRTGATSETKPTKLLADYLPRP